VRILAFLLIIVLFGAMPGCKKKADENRVDLDQIDVDNSNDYRYIFRDRIKEDEYQKNKHKKKNF
jgi:hypothetical protein